MSHRLTNPSVAVLYARFGRCFGLDRVGMEEVVGQRRCENEGMSATISRREMATMSPCWFEPDGWPET